MCSRKSIFWKFFWVICFLQLSILNAQSKEDSLYNQAVIDVYDNPDKTIEFAKNYFKENSNNPKKQVQALLLISNSYASKRDYQKSLEYALKSKEIKISDEHKVLEMQILNKIAAQYHQLGVNDKALEVLDEADLATTNYQHQDSIRFLIGNNYAIRGFIYRDQLSCDIAIEYLNKAYREFSFAEESPRSMANKSVTAYNIANCYVNLNQIESAKAHFLTAKHLAQQADANSLTSFAMKGLAEIYTLESQYEKAIQELILAEKLADKVGDLVLNRGIYQGLSANYLAIKDWENYHKFNVEFEELSSQIKQNERSTINTILDHFSQEMKEKKSKMRLQYFAIFTALICVFFGLIFWIFRRQKYFQSQLNRLKYQIKI